MIVDNLQNVSAYTSVNKHFAAVIDYINTHDLASMPAGYYPIDGDDVYLKLQEGQMKSQVEAKIERHHKMIDIQIPLTQDETYGYADLTNREAEHFDQDGDIGFLPELASECYVTCKVGMFAVFFPQDGHAPMIGDTSKKIKKAIFKVKV